MNPESHLAIIAKEFLEARKYASNLDEILASLDQEETAAEAINLLGIIFMELLKRRTMFQKVQPNDISVSEYVSWLKNAYSNVWSKLLSKVSNGSIGQHALGQVFSLMGQEGKFPITAPKKGIYFFPSDKLQIILKTCYSANSNQTAVHKQIDEYTNYIDVVYYFWLLTAKLLSKLNKPKEKQVLHIISILRRIPIPTEEELEDLNEEVLLCYSKNKSKFKPKYNELQESVQKLWSIILRWNHTPNTHKKSLILLIESVMPHLPKPILSMDYLMESLNAGGSISLLALQGIFTLVKDHNLEYPNIYGKLYSFFHPSIFYTKYKSRLYVLANIFLSSTHLPENLVASFIKRFARLCLEAPPHDIIILSAFIGNLLIRHPSLKILIQHPVEKIVSADPFNDDERDPLNTKAIESSLWELEALQNHILPKVSAACSFINKPLPNVEWDLTALIDLSYEQIFVKECQKNIQKVSLTFEKPDSLVLPRTSYFLDFWDF